LSQAFCGQYLIDIRARYSYTSLATIITETKTRIGNVDVHLKKMEFIK